jgi:hypothetical protein
MPVGFVALFSAGFSVTLRAIDGSPGVTKERPVSSESPSFRIIMSAI